MSPDVVATAGSDITLRLTWRDNTGAAVNLAGYSVEVLATGILAERSTATIVAAAAGVTEIQIEGTSPLPLGYHQLRMQLNNINGNSIASRLIRLEVE